MLLSLRFWLLAWLTLAALSSHAQASVGTLGTLSVGLYTSNAQAVLTGPYQAGAKLATKVSYTNTSGLLQDSLAFTAQVLGNGYAQGLQLFAGRLQGLGATVQRDYALGDVELPGPGSYLVQVSAFVYNRLTDKWVSGPVRIYWLFPLDNPLPVGLVRFAGAAAADSVTLGWETASETNCAGFEVQRSFNGSTWYPRGFIVGHGSTTQAQRYHYTEAQLLVRAFYRLRQLDYNGQEYFSPVVVLAPTPIAAAAAKVYPNPAHEQAQLDGPAGTPVRFYDDNGRLRRQQTLDTSGLLDLRGLSPGTYHLLLGEGKLPQRTHLVVF